MASCVSFRDVGVPLSRLSKRDHGAGLRVGRWPAGGGSISRPSVPLLFCLPFAVMSQAGGGGGQGCGVRTRGWGRGPARRGLTGPSPLYKGEVTQVVRKE